jgi:hypothetical protein
MNLDTSPILSLLFVAAFFAFAIGWVMFNTRRLRPFVRQKLAERWGLKIVERIRFRSTTWDIQGEHTRQQGCIVSIVQAFTEFGCMVLPIFGALAGIIALMMLLSGS